MTDAADMTAFDPKAFCAALPNLPGVYRMLGAEGGVLYVGKAKDLKKRVSSYFQKTLASPRIAMMVAQIAAIETTVTQSEAEALLLENNLIKALGPRYNILFRDDKSYPYVMLTGHAFPRLAFHRGSLDKKNRYFGPFPNSHAVRESIQLIQKVFRLRTCEDSVFNNRSRPCLLHQIKRCTAPCVGLVDAERYRTDVDDAERFLKGKAHDLLTSIERRMVAAASAQCYEEAAMLRDQLFSLRKVQERQFVSSASGHDADVIACVELEGLACVNLVMIRGGRHLGDRSFFPKNAEGWDSRETLDAFISQHYLEGQAPSLIIIGENIDAQDLEAALARPGVKPPRILVRPVGERRVWLEMAARNAELAIRHALAQRATQSGRALALQQALDLADPPRRIECFDISHTQGEATVASCVVWEEGGMKSGDYRRYNIGTAAAGDDYGAMREVLERRYRKLAEGEGRAPDLVLIDGGRGQVNATRQVLDELGLGEMVFLGVAKGESRKAGLEQLVFPDRENPLKLPADHPGLHLIQEIRDEAHRFAISGHRARRGKARRVSRLEEIEGVGAKRRQSLLTRFGGLKELEAASLDEIAKVDGISKALAERIYKALH